MPCWAMSVGSWYASSCWSSIPWSTTCVIASSSTGSPATSSPPPPSSATSSTSPPREFSNATNPTTHPSSTTTSAWWCCVATNDITTKNWIGWLCSRLIGGFSRGWSSRGSRRRRQCRRRTFDNIYIYMVGIDGLMDEQGERWDWLCCWMNECNDELGLKT